MIEFNIICELKEVKSMEHINQPIHINNINLRRHVNHLDILSLGPTDVMYTLSHIHSHAIGMTTSKNPKSLSQAFLPLSRDPIFQCYASDLVIAATFLGQQPT